MANERTIPAAVEARRPGYEQIAREMLGMPPEWQVMRWEAKGKHPNYYGVLVTGAIPGVLTRGPRKGKPNWRKRTMEASVTIMDAVEKAWIAAWERDTGHCHECFGSGLRFSSWSASEGHTYVPCKRCNATGLATLQSEAALTSGGAR